VNRTFTAEDEPMPDERQFTERVPFIPLVPHRPRLPPPEDFQAAHDVLAAHLELNKQDKIDNPAEKDLTGEERIDHPSHYTQGRYEPIDVIEDWELGFHEGNALKYLARSRHKGNQVEDLRKAAWYLMRYADTLEKKSGMEER